jgi:hypothetical protein
VGVNGDFDVASTSLFGPYFDGAMIDSGKSMACADWLSGLFTWDHGL